jgi:branched-chain amino acid aminotransferase
MSLLWLNGTLIDAGSARIDPADRGFTLGDGVFETLRMQDGSVLHAARHFARLRHGAGVLGIAIEYTDDTLCEALRAVTRAAGLRDAAVRLTLTRGPAPRGVLPAPNARPTVLIAAAPLPSPLPPAHVVVVRRTCRNEFSPLSRIKSLNYLDSILARQEAAEGGADDALLLNTRGHLAEASAANIFLQIDGTLLTPPVADGALPGIQRQLILETHGAREFRITEQDIARATAGFLTNSLSIRPLAAINGRKLAAGTIL